MLLAWIQELLGFKLTTSGSVTPAVFMFLREVGDADLLHTKHFQLYILLSQHN